jgi:hypothetical protein
MEKARDDTVNGVDKFAGGDMASESQGNPTWRSGGNATGKPTILTFCAAQPIL